MAQLLAWWDNNKPKEYNGPDVIGSRPQPRSVMHYVGSWSLLPVIFFASWCFILYRYIFYGGRDG